MFRKLHVSKGLSNCWLSDEITIKGRWRSSLFNQRLVCSSSRWYLTSFAGCGARSYSRGDAWSSEVFGYKNGRRT